MATPTTNKRLARPAASKPTAQTHTLNVNAIQLEDVSALAGFWGGVAGLSLVSIRCVLGADCKVQAAPHYKKVHACHGLSIQMNELFGFKKIRTKPVFMLQNMFGQTFEDLSGGQSMQLASWLQQRLRMRAVKQAWGLAPAQKGWFLLGLGKEASPWMGVHTVQYFPGDLEDQSVLGVSHGLRQIGASRGAFQGRHRVNMGLPMAQVVSGVLAVPLGWEPSDGEAEVQLEAARALGLEPQEVSFDWQADPLSDGVVAQWQWVACAQSAVEQFNQCARRAGWQLASVEPEWQAAQRAASCLSGGMSVLLTRPAQDWRFDLALLPDSQAKGAAMLNPSGLDATLRDALQTSAGPRLVAAGLALKAWT